MEIHLLVLDLDGTLLNAAKEISTPTADAVIAARNAGVKVVLATARPPRSVMPFYRRLELDAPMINYNGALVYDPPAGRIVMHRPLPLKTTRKIIELARGMYPQVLVSAEILDRWYTDRLDGDFLTETARLLRPDVVAPLDQWLDQAVTKLLLLGDPVQLAAVRAAIWKDYTHQVSMVQTEDYLLQIMHSTVSKVQAVRVVAGEMGISRANVMAIGDNANDVGMLTWAGIGVAMGNGIAEALAAADYVTGDNLSDGVARAIKKFILS